MCGLKPCKTCSAKKRRNSRISGASKRRTMARRTSKKGIAKAATQVGTLIIGGIAASQLDRIPMVSQNPLLGGIVKFAVGTLVIPKMVGGQLGAGIGLGVAYQGGKEVLNSVSPGMISGFDTSNFLRTPGSTSVSAVAGSKVLLD